MQVLRETTDLGVKLADALTSALQAHDRVIWLVPGGSNIDISVDASQLLDSELTRRLVIMQTDERFVALDSADCNWYQLANAGFDTKYATTFPMLIEGKTRDEVAELYGETVLREFIAADYIVGQFGVGSDGHIAGIKPNSPASTSDELVSGYQGEDFERVTLTFPALQQVDEAFAFVFGEAKRPILEELLGDIPSLAEFPAGVLRTTPISTVYNDQIEDN
ncbi:MAG TPA: 6-phosphogluconolactonase [Patescibacteria group bacterium]|nr:6-phosphogluconolactonase [Patescibacteria group bacterium]